MYSHAKTLLRPFRIGRAAFPFRWEILDFLPQLDQFAGKKNIPFLYSILLIDRRRRLFPAKGVVDVMQIWKQSMRYFNFNIPSLFDILLSIEQVLIQQRSGLPLRPCPKPAERQLRESFRFRAGLVCSTFFTSFLFLFWHAIANIRPLFILFTGVRKRIPVKC